MSGLALQNVVKEFGSFRAVNNVDLNVPHGTFVCMLARPVAARPRFCA